MELIMMSLAGSLVVLCLQLSEFIGHRTAFGAAHTMTATDGSGDVPAPASRPFAVIVRQSPA
jgi:hypothetical protein